MDLKFNKHRAGICFWFVQRPSLYKQFCRELISFIKRKEHPTLAISKEAKHWCEKLAVDENHALKLISPSWKYLQFNEEFPSLVEDAFRIIKSLDCNWGGQGNISLNYNLANLFNAKHILETGVAYGWSSLSLLKSLDQRGTGSLISIDMPFWGTKYENQIGCVIPKKLHNRWQLIRLPDRDALPEILKSAKPFDLCHYDSDKSYDGKIWALPRIWNRINDQGLIICDDISDNLAFKDFCENFSLNPIIVKTYDSQVEKYVGIVVK